MGPLEFLGPGLPAWLEAANGAKRVRLEVAEGCQPYPGIIASSLGLEQGWLEGSDLYGCSEAVLLPGLLQTGRL